LNTPLEIVGYRGAIETKNYRQKQAIHLWQAYRSA
jgi:hypothetical protein